MILCKEKEIPNAELTNGISLGCLREDIPLIVRIRYRTKKGDSMAQFTHGYVHLKALLPHTKEQ